MIDGRTVLAVVPARGGSRRLPGKNIKPLGGRPMIAWTIDAANGSRHVDRTILSSEDAEIRRVAAGCGLDSPFDRPESLSADTSSSADVLLHALDALDDTYDMAVLLQPTSPLRTADDIDDALETMIARDAASCVTVSPVMQSPYWMYSVDETGRMARLLGGDSQPTSHPPPAYIVNGAFYGVRVPWFRDHKTLYARDTIAHEMPGARSVDVDTELDFLLAEVLLRWDGRQPA